MSRIGQKPIEVPAGVQASLVGQTVSVHIVPLDKSRETLSQDEPDACEEALLSASDYLLETYLSRAQRISPFHSLWRDSLRHGHREASNAAERSKEYSEGGRLRAGGLLLTMVHDAGLGYIGSAADDLGPGLIEAQHGQLQARRVVRVVQIRVQKLQGARVARPAETHPHVIRPDRIREPLPAQRPPCPRPPPRGGG